MTTPDEKALEAVKDAAQGWEGASAPAIAEWAIRAYLDALPPARRMYLVADDPVAAGETVTQVEIREIRNA